MRKPGKRRFTFGMAIAIALFFLVTAVSVSYVGFTSKIWSGGNPLTTLDVSAVPQSVIEDASRIASALFSDEREQDAEYKNQLLATYIEAKDRDFVVFFNPGGWGWNLIAASPGWSSIITGIKSELTRSGYDPLLLNYHRTKNTLRGRLNEMVEMFTGYSSKANQLAHEVQFLTSHIPDLKILIAGESNGTIISDQAMRMLVHNPQVYSIQTGTPFWHDSVAMERTLVLNSNGITPDSFSQGDFLIMVRANVKTLMGVTLPKEQSGAIGHFIKAPGHDYWWQYPGVYPRVIKFLNENFLN